MYKRQGLLPVKAQLHKECISHVFHHQNIPSARRKYSDAVSYTHLLYVQKHGNGEVKSLQQIHSEISDK